MSSKLTILETMTYQHETLRSPSATLALPRPETPLSRPSSPARRHPSRSPQPYRRRGSVLDDHAEAATIDMSGSTPERKEVSRKTSYGYGGSESGTEADDEGMPRKITAPPVSSSRRVSSGEEIGDSRKSNGDPRGRRKARLGDAEGKSPSTRPRPPRIVFARRVIELLLFVVQVMAVLLGESGGVWREILSRRREFLVWGLSYAAPLLSYPVRLLIRRKERPIFQWPKSLDPAPLLYPTFLPVLVALSLAPAATAATNNPRLLANLVLSLSSLPPTLIPSSILHWMLSLAPLLTSTPSISHEQNDALALIPPINATLTSALTTLLHPSLTPSELRLLSSALINLLFHARSPQATILKALIWFCGLGVLILCEDVIQWNTNLARVPLHRFRRAGHAIMGIKRFSRLRSLKGAIPSSIILNGYGYQKASDSENDQVPLLTTGKKKPNFYTSLSPRQATTRRWIYALSVYGAIAGLVLFGLRPYIRDNALDGRDPFLWAPAYVFCGVPWYQSLIDNISPGSGYCVTAASTSAANTRLAIILYWLITLVLGISTAVYVSSHPDSAVDTRRKVFHGTVVFLFLIPGLIDPPFTHLALSAAMALFLVTDMLRAGQIPPGSGIIAGFLAPFVDGRDLKGPVVVSHVFLLLGCAVGWWLSLAGVGQKDWDWIPGGSELAFVAGVVGVGLGDTAASLVGRRIGFHKWGWRGGKSVEGSLAFVVAVVGGLAAARSWILFISSSSASAWPWAWETKVWPWVWGGTVWVKLLGIATWGAMAEATVTGINDNVVIPVGVWTLVRAAGV